MTMSRETAILLELPGARTLSPSTPVATRSLPELQVPTRRVSTDIVCFSRRRWEASWPRTQQLMSRFARLHRVFFVEEPVSCADGTTSLEVHAVRGGVQVAVPKVPRGLASDRLDALMEVMTRELLARWRIDAFVAWYDDADALSFTRRLVPLARVYDCPDAPPATTRAAELEMELCERADVVFVAERRLVDRLQGNIHFMPSVDREHFASARGRRPVPIDQACLHRPIVGCAGGVEAPPDVELLLGSARARRDLTFVVLGAPPVDPSGAAPCEPNLYWLGERPYDRLPDYLAGWDVALLPSTPPRVNGAPEGRDVRLRAAEYLAAGKRVVTTSLDDVLAYRGLVDAAGSCAELVAAIELALGEGATEEWLQEVDVALAEISYERVWARMAELVDDVTRAKRGLSPAQAQQPGRQL